MFGTLLAIFQSLIKSRTSLHHGQQTPNLQLCQKMCRVSASLWLRKPSAALFVLLKWSFIQRRTSLTRCQGCFKEENLTDWKVSSRASQDRIMANRLNWKEVYRAQEAQQQMKRTQKGWNSIVTVNAVEQMLGI